MYSEFGLGYMNRNEIWSGISFAGNEHPKRLAENTPVKSDKKVRCRELVGPEIVLSE